MADAAAQTQTKLRLRPWLAGPFAFIALLIVVRFVLELIGMSHQFTRYLSSTGAVYLVAIYMGAVAPLRGVRKSWQIILPGVLLAAWTPAGITMIFGVSMLLHLEDG